MENAEEVFQCLEDFTKRRPKVIPRELEDYLNFVARTGDPVYQWALVKNLFKEKLLNVITEFFETSPGLDIPHCPNVDIFNYETMKNSLMEKIDAFSSAPFTVQRICELLTSPRKQYNRIDKFMRAIEKNILVVSTRDPGPLRHSESENGEGPEAMVNGSDSNSDYNVDVEMEDMSSWKENADPLQTYAVQAGSSDSARTADSSSSPFISQNGPAQGEQTSPEVELMTIEPDTHLSTLDEDIPEASTSEAELSPSEETKNNNDPLPESSEERPLISVPVDSEESVLADTKTERLIEPLVQSSEDSGAVISTSKESDEKLESVPDPMDSTISSDSIVESLPKEKIADLLISDSIEVKTEGTSVISDDSKIAVDTNLDMESVSSPDTSSEDKLSEPESMESMESQDPEASPPITEDSSVTSKVGLEIVTPEVVSSPEAPIIITEEHVTEVATSIEMDDNDSKDNQTTESESSSALIIEEVPESPKTKISVVEEVTVADVIENIDHSLPLDISPALVESAESAEAEENVAISNSETISEIIAPEVISVDPEITLMKEPVDVAADKLTETKTSEHDLVDKESPAIIAEVSKPPSPLPEVPVDSPAPIDS